MLGSSWSLARAGRRRRRGDPAAGHGRRLELERISWFREYHRAAAAGLDGPARQKSWAISCDGQTGRVHSADADRSAGPSRKPGSGWARSFRGLGIGREALRPVKSLAAPAGAEVLEADTTAGNCGRPVRARIKAAGAETRHRRWLRDTGLTVLRQGQDPLKLIQLHSRMRTPGLDMPSLAVQPGRSLDVSRAPSPTTRPRPSRTLMRHRPLEQSGGWVHAAMNRLPARGPPAREGRKDAAGIPPRLGPLRPLPPTGQCRPAQASAIGQQCPWCPATAARQQ